MGNAVWYLGLTPTRPTADMELNEFAAIPVPEPPNKNPRHLYLSKIPTGNHI